MFASYKPRSGFFRVCYPIRMKRIVITKRETNPYICSIAHIEANRVFFCCSSLIGHLSINCIPNELTAAKVAYR